MPNKSKNDQESDSKSKFKQTTEGDFVHRYRLRKHTEAVHNELDSLRTAPPVEQIAIVEQAWIKRGRKIVSCDGCEYYCQCWQYKWAEIAASALEKYGFNAEEIRNLTWSKYGQAFYPTNEWSEILLEIASSRCVGCASDNHDALLSIHLLCVEQFQLPKRPLITDHNEGELSNTDSRKSVTSVIVKKGWSDYLEAVWDDYSRLKSYEPDLANFASDLSATRSIFPMLTQETSLHVNLILFSIYQVRNVREFNGGSQEELIDHVFVLYPVPKCLYEVWQGKFRAESKVQLKSVIWFLALAQGVGFSDLGKAFGWNIPPGLPSYLNKVPSGNGFVSSIVFAEVFRLGGTELDAQRLLRDPSFGIDFTDPVYEDQFQKFWRDTIAWLIKHRDAIDDEQSAKILAWAQHCFTEGRLGRQRGFSWKRRSPRVAIQASDAYNEQTHRSAIGPRTHLRWSSHGWDWDFTAEDGQAWSFRELTS